jgi:excisionase family DNA binding protein
MSTNEGQIAEPIYEVAEIAQELLLRIALLCGGFPRDISNSQYRMLATVHAHGPLSVGALGQGMGLAVSTTSEMVTRLVKTGLVTNLRNRFDGRVVMVGLTDDGRQLLRRHRALARERFEKVTSRLSPGDRDLLLSAMKQLAVLLDKGAPSGGRKKPKPSRSAIRKRGWGASMKFVPAAPVAAPAVPQPGGFEAPPARVFSVHQASQMCGVSREKIRRWIQKYGLVAYNTHDGLAIKITETDLREFSERLKVYVDWESVDGEG